MKLGVITWKWGDLFDASYVNRMASMLARHLDLPHTLYCITDDAVGIDESVQCVAMPKALRYTPRCRRRMQQYAAGFDKLFGERLLSLDLDMVIVLNITPLLLRPHPIMMWKVGYAGVYSGSFVAWNAGALDGAWRTYKADPEGFPQRCQPNGVGSDQAMLNVWIKESRAKVATWTETDGFVTYFGEGYESREKFGVGPKRTTLPPGARIVVLGSADKQVLDEGRYAWVKEHWR